MIKANPVTTNNDNNKAIKTRHENLVIAVIKC